MVPPCHQQYTVITCTSATLSPMVSVEDEMWRRTHRHKHPRTRTCACTRSHTCTRPQATAAKKLDLPGTDWVLSVQNPKIQDLKHMRDGLIAMVVVAGLVLSGGWASWHGLTVGLVNVVHTYGQRGSHLWSTWFTLMIWCCLAKLGSASVRPSVCCTHRPVLPALGAVRFEEHGGCSHALESSVCPRVHRYPIAHPPLTLPPQPPVRRTAAQACCSCCSSATRRRPSCLRASW